VGASTNARLRGCSRGAHPIDGIGIGSKLGVSADAPYLDMAYKLVVFAGRPVLKLSTGKATLPGAKQVWRRHEAGRFVRDLITLADEASVEDEPLLQPVMTDGNRKSLHESLEAARTRAATQRALLAQHHRLVDAQPYAVDVSQRLHELDADLKERLALARPAGFETVGSPHDDQCKPRGD